jgi:hypothetical protein
VDRGLRVEANSVVSISAGAYVPAGLALERSRPSRLRKGKMVELQVGTRKSVVGVAVRAGPAPPRLAPVAAMLRRIGATSVTPTTLADQELLLLHSAES